MKTQTPSLEFSHFPVMLSEIIKISSPHKGGIFVDCTFGGGGYTKALLKFPKVKIIGIDRDNASIPFAKEVEKNFNKRFEFYNLKFSQIDKIIKKNVDVIIFDLGLSSIQLKNLKRGFSFKSKEKLDMNMGFSNLSAEDAVNNLSQEELKLVIKILGEEKEASIIARNIVKARSKKKITKVDDLVKIIEKSKKKNFSKKINPSTKTFQALRIFVNKEISELVNGIVNATKLLKPGGKILVVSFHSIEDKIIKYFFSNFSENKSKPSRYLPEDNDKNLILFDDYNKKVLKPSIDEIKKNNPSSSAKLRFAIRNNNKFIFPKEFFLKFRKYLDLEAINV
tara:strand:- start:26991 stop:28001 length:1011 start_codon:yes stop_codon:yes gene_type:complete